jgi:hypothetical protein
MFRAIFFARRIIVAMAGVLITCQSALAGVDLSRAVRFDRSRSARRT